MSVETEKLTDAEQKLVVDHMDYVQRVARRFHSQFGSCGIDVEDCLSAGYIGLCRAAQRYDAAVCSDFKLYSFLRVRGAMYDLLRAHNGIGRAMYKHLQRRWVEESEVSGDDRSPAAEPERPSVLPRFAFAHSTAQLRRLSQVIEQVGIQVHVKANQEDVELSYLDDVSPETAAHEVSVRRYLDRLLGELPEQQREVLKLRYYEGYSYGEMGDLLQGATKSWLSRLHGRAIDQLKDRLAEEADVCALRAMAHGG